MTFRIRAVLILFGVMLFVMGFRELQLRGMAEGAPQAITCADLAHDGPGDNAFVRLSDYMLCDFDFVYASEDEAGKKWTDAWVPVVPADSAYAREIRQIRAEYGDDVDFPSPADFKVILWLPSAESYKEVSEAASRQALQGMVINGFDPLGSDERRYLEETYPKVDIRSCWILQLDRRPAGLATLLGLFGGGALLFGGTLLWVWAAHRRRTYSPRAGREHVYMPARQESGRSPYAPGGALAGETRETAPAQPAGHNPYAPAQEPGGHNPYAPAQPAPAPGEHNPYAPPAPPQGSRPRMRVPKERS